MHPNIHIFGIQGSGKDTQASLLAKRFNLVHISSGAILRSRIEQHDTLSDALESYLDSGQLVPASILLPVISETVATRPEGSGIVGAGMLRTEEELRWFAEQWATLDLMHPFGIELVVSETTARERIARRKRSDDTPDAIERRFTSYRLETLPVVEILRTEGSLVSIDGEGSVEVIAERIAEHVKGVITDGTH